MNEQDSNSPQGEKLVLTSPEAASTRRDFFLWIGVLALGTLIVYGPSIRGGFLWDDNQHVINNSSLRSAEGLGRTWFELRKAGQAGPIPQYYPLTHTTYWIEYQLFAPASGELNAMVFRVTNVLLHACAATLLWFLLRRLAVPGAWLIAAAWALHPVQVETVAWISERKSVLSAIFFFASILAYLKFESIGERESGRSDKQRFDTYLLALGMYICALLSKTVACSAPAVILLLIWWKRGRVTTKQVRLLLPFFAIGLGLSAITAHMEYYAVGAHGDDWNLSAAQRILVAGHAVWFYLAKLLAPINLSFFYSRWDMNHAPAWWWIYPLGVIAVLAILWSLRNRIGRAPFTAAAIYVGVLVPALGFFNVYPMRYSYVADHFQYQASAAMIALIVGWLAGMVGLAARRWATEQEPSPMPYVASALLLIALGGTSAFRSRIFADSILLWRDTLAKNPASWIAQNNLGAELFFKAADTVPPDADVLDEAEMHLAEAIRLRPAHDMAYATWGKVLLLREKPKEAQGKFEAALKINPKNIDALAGRARTLFMQQNFEQAMPAYREASAVADGDKNVSRLNRAKLHGYFAETLIALGKDDDATAEYKRALEIRNEVPEVHYGFARLLIRKGRLKEAADHLVYVIRVQPNGVEARVDLAKLMMRVGNLNGAAVQLREAVALEEQRRKLGGGAAFAFYPPLLEAATEWAEKMKAATQPSTKSSTQPSTTQSTTTRATTRP